MSTDKKFHKKKFHKKILKWQRKQLTFTSNVYAIIRCDVEPRYRLLFLSYGQVVI